MPAPRSGNRARAATACALVIAAAPAVRADPPATLAVARGTPALDGALDDPAWRRATISPRFRQREPAPGELGTHDVRARLLYDDAALYVAVECAARARPEARLGRRDAIPAGEQVRVLIDARGEGTGAFAFATNPAGVQADALVAADGSLDYAWDAVWDVEVVAHARGWRAEFRVPWRALRFDAGAPALRVQVERDDFAAGETTALVPVPADAPRFIARFLPLAGVAGLRPARVFELRPFALGRARLAADPARLDATPVLSGTLGADLKLGLTNDLVLDATANPDFGQVEVDPAVLNLSTFEVFFPERRPFFLEGSDLFRTPLRLVHTRRIGAVPSAPGAAHAGGAIESVDPATAIWGAAKLTGRVGPLTLAVLDAVTGPTFARERYVDATGATQRAPVAISPAVNWLAARARGNLAPGSTVGALATHVGRVGAPHDVAGGIDWDLRAPDGVHRLVGQVAAAHGERDGVARDGQALYLEVSRAEDPVFTWAARVRAYSRGFDPNGFGYLERADLVSATLSGSVRTSRPVGPLRSAYVSAFATRTTNTAGVVLENSLGSEAGLTGRSQWSGGLGVQAFTTRFDDRETRGGIPYQLEPTLAGWAWIDTDPRTPLRGGLYGDVSNQNGGYRTSATAYATWVPAPQVSLSLSATARGVTNMPRWVATETDAAGVARAVFGQQRAEIVDATARAALAFTRRITLDVFAQLLVGAVRHEDFRALVAPDRLEPFALAGARAFERASLTVNAVARWEFRPGSFLSAVVLHRQALAVAAHEPGYGSGLGLLGLARPDTTLLTKLTYLVL